MCGLVFLYNANLSQDTGAARIQGAIAALRHRGPDEQGAATAGAAQFGHARLSIVDLGDSHQPMKSPDGRYTLVFNGEIYNYRELRSALAARWVFRTHGDTEVLLAGLILEGQRFLQRLEGMWAFALWDEQVRRLLLSRDRMGKKPLYYFSGRGQFGCASELPALRRLADSAWSEDLDSTADYFRYGYCLPGYTMWQGVFEVLPAHYLDWTPDGSILQQPYWRLPCPATDTSSASDESLADVLRQAVAKRLVADVEVGAFLSGGIDSSLVCALAQAQMDRPLRTYTIGFADRAFDESAYAERVAKFLGTDHGVEVFPSWDEPLLERLLRDHVGQAFADASLLPTALVSKVAARDVKVVLSGDGADELFGGYQRYQARLILRWYTRLPAKLKARAESAVRALPEPTAHHSRSLLKKAHLFVDIAQRQRAETPYTAPLLFHPEEYGRLFPDLVGRGKKPYGLPDLAELDDLQQMLCSDALVYLPQDILAKVDRASMANSLETRAPFLDHKVVEAAFSRAAHRHLALGRGKRWIRDVFRTHLPSETWRRRKQGFGVPLHQWFRGTLGKQLEAALAENTGPISRSAAGALLEAHRATSRDNGYRLWMMHVYLRARQQ